MPWIDLRTKGHNCRLNGGLPNPNVTGGAEVGSSYLCDQEGCDRMYILQYDQREGSYYWDEFPHPPPI